MRGEAIIVLSLEGRYRKCHEWAQRTREENKRCSSIAVSILAGCPCLRFLPHLLRDFQARLDNHRRSSSEFIHTERAKNHHSDLGGNRTRDLWITSSTSQHLVPNYLYSNRRGFVAQWLKRWTSHPKVPGSIPTEVRVMIFRSLGVDKLEWTSSMIIEYTRVASFPQSSHLYISSG